MDWISVEDKPAVEMGIVLIMTKRSEGGQGYYSQTREQWFWDIPIDVMEEYGFCFDVLIPDVTHWMPIPEAK